MKKKDNNKVFDKPIRTFAEYSALSDEEKIAYHEMFSHEKKPFLFRLYDVLQGVAMFFMTLMIAFVSFAFCCLLVMLITAIFTEGIV